MENSTDYVPGACNLNRKGVLERRRGAIITFAVGVLAFFGMRKYDVPIIAQYLIMVGIAWLAIVYVRESRNRFCILNGLTGYEGTSGVKREIETTEYRNKDLNLVGKEVLIATLLALVIGLVVFISY